MDKRRSGILLHPTSLPSPYGIGDLGRMAVDFLDFLHEADQGLWQILPLGPTGYADSPYQCYSAFAGNELLLDPEWFADHGFVPESSLRKTPAGRLVEYDPVREAKRELLEEAWRNFQQGQAERFRDEFEDYYTREGWWLHDYALFATLKEKFDGKPWREWPEEYRRHDEAALRAINEELQERVLFHKFIQYAFDKQWQQVRDAAAERGILIIGDMPIFVSFDSADVWAWRHFFRVSEDGHPEVVAGVPPDYFSKTGQLWGNPHYNWEAMRADNFWWWRSRFSRMMRQVDVVRVDHFRGFESAWEVPGDAKTAEHGVWAPTPGRELFQVLQHQLPELRLIAEDLGVITPEVEALRDDFNLPGMRVFQFGFFSDGRDPFLPHNYSRHCIAYTGTHDNNTMRGFIREEGAGSIRNRMFDYLGITREEDFAWASVEAIWRSSANWAVVPMQDLLNLDGSGRMNTPGTTAGNWAWRMSGRYPKKRLARELSALTRRFGRNLEG